MRDASFSSTRFDSVAPIMIPDIPIPLDIPRARLCPEGPLNLYTVCGCGLWMLDGLWYVNVYGDWYLVG